MILFVRILWASSFRFYAFQRPKVTNTVFLSEPICKLKIAHIPDDIVKEHLLS